MRKDYSLGGEGAQRAGMTSRESEQELLQCVCPTILFVSGYFLDWVVHWIRCLNNKELATRWSSVERNESRSILSSNLIIYCNLWLGFVDQICTTLGFLFSFGPLDLHTENGRWSAWDRVWHLYHGTWWQRGVTTIPFQGTICLNPKHKAEGMGSSFWGALWQTEIIVMSTHSSPKYLYTKSVYEMIWNYVEDFKFLFSALFSNL